MIAKRLPYTVLLSFIVFGAAQPAISFGQDASKYYTVMHPEQFEIDWTSFYKQADQRTAEIRERLPHHLNLAYGDDPKQQLDLYLPDQQAAGAPVFLFLHGGGFREGDKAQYGFIAEPFADAGIITAVASYRLTGDGYHYPDQPDDTKRAILWLYHHVRKYGGNPDAMYVGGHSAGAILAADVGVDRSWLEDQGIPKESLRGIAPVSGPYDLRASGRPGEGDAYAPTTEQQVEASPVLKIADPVPAAVVAVGSQEERFLGSSQELVEKLEGSGVDAELLVLDGEDHKDTALSLANADSRLFKTILNMITESPRCAELP